jgi:hypothetical protein
MVTHSRFLDTVPQLSAFRRKEVTQAMLQELKVQPLSLMTLALLAGTTYVYDVEVSKTVPGSYNQVHTLLTGNISVTDHVSGSVAP